MPATKRDSLNMERSRQRYTKTIQIEPIEPARLQLSSGCLVVVIDSRGFSKPPLSKTVLTDEISVRQDAVLSTITAQPPCALHSILSKTFRKPAVTNGSPSP
jgi:hypothetical protein